MGQRNEHELTKKKLELAMSWLQDIEKIGSATSMLATTALIEIQALDDQYPFGEVTHE